jgi:hypothetical protein
MSEPVNQIPGGYHSGIPGFWDGDKEALSVD